MTNLSMTYSIVTEAMKGSDLVEVDAERGIVKIVKRA